MRMKRAQTKRKPTNLSLDTALVKEAQTLGLNLSRILEEHLREAVREERQRKWLEENKEAFEALNRFHEKYGIFNAEDREW
jgi:antitoxin CcdA